MPYKLIGKDFTPFDIEAKVTGRAKYSEDFRAEGMLFAKLYLSPMPHAKVRDIDLSEALKMKGVEGGCGRVKKNPVRGSCHTRPCSLMLKTGPPITSLIRLSLTEGWEG